LSLFLPRRNFHAYIEIALRKKIAALEERYPYFKKIYTALSLQLSERLLRIALGIIVQALLARHLGPEHYGKLSYVTKFVGLFMSVALFGMDELIIKDLVLHRDAKEYHPRIMSLFVMRFGLACLAMLSLVIATILIQHEEVKYSAMVLIYGLTYFASPFLIFETFYTQNLNMKVSFRTRSFNSVGSSLAKIGGALANAKVSFFVFVTLIEDYVLALSFGRLYRSQNKGLEWTFMKDYCKKMLIQASPLFVVSFLILLDQRVSIVILEKYSSNEQLSLFTISQSMIDILQFIPLAISASLFPSLISSHSRDPEQFAKRLQWYIWLLFWVSIAMWVGAKLTAPLAFPLLFGDKYPMLPTVFGWALTANIFTYFNIARLRWFTLENHVKTWLVLHLIGIPLSIYLQIQFAEKDGAVGAIKAYCVAQIAVNLLMALFSKQIRKSLWIFIRAPLFPIEALKFLRKT
jgi:O-antigen/teichoic acid export membrane protein